MGGKFLVFPPDKLKQIVVLDTDTMEAQNFPIPEEVLTEFGFGSHHRYMFMNALAKHDVVVFTPYWAKRVLLFDMGSKDMKTVQLPGECEKTGSKFAGSMIMGNKIYFAPRSYLNVVIMDLTTHEVVEEKIPDVPSFAYAWNGCVNFGYRMYMLPATTDTVLEVVNCAYQVEEWGLA